LKALKSGQRRDIIGTTLLRTCTVKRRLLKTGKEKIPTVGIGLCGICDNLPYLRAERLFDFVKAIHWPKDQRAAFIHN